MAMISFDFSSPPLGDVTTSDHIATAFHGQFLGIPFFLSATSTLPPDPSVRFGLTIARMQHHNWIW
jgi:hypothetical protein